MLLGIYNDLNLESLEAIKEKIRQANKSDVVLLNIGTDRCTGDSLGPLVGTFIENKIDIPIYGTLKETVTAKNISSIIEEIHSKYENPYIIAVDASLGNSKDVGNIKIEDTPLYPGRGLRKDIQPVGDISIYGIVNMNSDFNFLVLNNTKLSIVYEMAKRIEQILIYILK